MGQAKWEKREERRKGGREGKGPGGSCSKVKR